MVRKITGKAPSVGKAVSAGVALGAVWTLVCAIIIAKMVDMEVLALGNVGYASMATVLGAVFTGASLAGRKAGYLAVQASALSGGAYYLCLLLINAMFFGGSYDGMGTTLLLVVLASGAVILMAGKRRGRNGRKRYKIPGK